MFTNYNIYHISTIDLYMFHVLYLFYIRYIYMYSAVYLDTIKYTI